MLSSACKRLHFIEKAKITSKVTKLLNKNNLPIFLVDTSTEQMKDIASSFVILA